MFNNTLNRASYNIIDGEFADAGLPTHHLDDLASLFRSFPINSVKCLAKSTPVWTSIAVATLFTLAAASVPIARYVLSDRQKTIASSLALKYLGKPLHYDARKSFRETLSCVATQKLSGRPAHSHPDCASHRAVTRVAIREFLHLNGLAPFHLSPSLVESESGDTCERLYYSPKDLVQDVSWSTPRKNEVRVLVDVDYYVDLNTLLDGIPLITYGSFPVEPDLVLGETSSYFTADGLYHECVSGGASYVHELWDPVGDHRLVHHWWGTVMYLVEMVYLGRNKIVTYYEPKWMSYGPIARLFLSTVPCKRYRPIVGGYVKHERVIGGVTTIYAGPVGQSALAQFPATCLHVAIERARTAKHGLTVGDASMFLPSSVRDKTYAATVLHGLAAGAAIIQAPLVIQKPAISAANYTSVTQHVLDEPRPTIYDVSNPVFAGGFAPTRGSANTLTCVDGRIRHRKAVVTTYAPFIYRVLAEFVERVVPQAKVGTLSPCSEEQVEERQNRPSQRAGHAQAKHVIDIVVQQPFSCFQKAEAYPNITCPRNIVAPDVHDRVLQSRFSYPFSDHIMKSLPWYAFGSDPKTLAAKVRELAQTADEILLTDYTRLDGSTGPIFTDLLTRVVLRAYSLEYHKDLRANLNRYKTMKGRQGSEWFDVGHMTLSGSAWTSIRNSLLDAFVDYLGARFDQLDADQAWSALGLYGGDDGLRTGISAESVKRAATALGLEVVCDTRYRGQYVKFLGRLYLDPWSRVDNICDVKRLLGRFHLSVVRPDSLSNDPEVGRALILRRKVDSLSMTDPNTPIIRALSSHVRKMTKPLSPKEWSLTKPLGRWHDDLPVDYPVKDDPLVRGVVMTELELTPQELDDLELSITSCDSLGAWNSYVSDSLSNQHQPSVSQDVVIDGLIRPATKALSAPRPQVTRATLVASQQEPLYFETFDYDVHSEWLDVSRLAVAFEAGYSEREALPDNVQSRDYRHHWPSLLDQDFEALLSMATSYGMLYGHAKDLVLDVLISGAGALPASYFGKVRKPLPVPVENLPVEEPKPAPDPRSPTSALQEAERLLELVMAEARELDVLEEEEEPIDPAMLEPLPNFDEVI